MIALRSAEAVGAMRQAGRVVAEMLDVCAVALCPGVSTARLERLAEDVLARRGAESSFRGYPGTSLDFPSVICTSPNEIVVHGIPNDCPLEEGDIVAVDAGAIVAGWHADAAATLPVGDVDEDVQHLLDVAQGALEAGVAQVRDGNRVGAIGHAVQQAAELAGCSVVRDYVGHGIGRQMHEPPEVPNWGSPRAGITLRRGMTLAVEPMLNAGGAATELLDDEWTVVTADGSPSAHFEHTCLVTDGVPEILTLP